MNEPHPARRFPAGLALAAITAAAGLALAVAMGFIWALPDLAAARAVMLLGGLIGWAAAVAGLMPVVMMGSLGPRATTGAYMAGAGLRTMICLVAALLFILRKGDHAMATVLTLMGVYLATLFMEAAFVARFLWTTPSARQPAGGATPTTTSLEASA